MVVVADASPLIYLSRAGVLERLKVLFGEVVVPQTVWAEVVDQRPSAPGLDALTSARWLRVIDNEVPTTDLGLDPGDTAAILLAEGLNAELLLIDERMGRRVAEARGLTARGTLGVLVQARRTGALPTLRPVLENWQATDSESRQRCSGRPWRLWVSSTIRPPLADARFERQRRPRKGPCHRFRPQRSECAKRRQ